jgi:hypothetical protein
VDALNIKTQAYQVSADRLIRYVVPDSLSYEGEIRGEYVFREASDR